MKTAIAASLFLAVLPALALGAYEPTLDHFKCFFPGIHNIEDHLAKFKAEFADYPLANHYEAASLFGTIHHATSGLTVFKPDCEDPETKHRCSADFDVKCPWRCDIEPFPGAKYYSRGPLALTWSCNYKVMADKYDDQIIFKHPEKIAENLSYAWRSAAFVWNLKSEGAEGLWGQSCSDYTEAHDFSSCLQRLNGAECYESGHAAQDPRAEQIQRIAVHCLSAGLLSGVKCNLTGDAPEPLPECTNPPPSQTRRRRGSYATSGAGSAPANGPSGNEPNGNTPSENTPSGNTPSGNTPGGNNAGTPTSPAPAPQATSSASSSVFHSLLQIACVAFYFLA